MVILFSEKTQQLMQCLNDPMHWTLMRIVARQFDGQPYLLELESKDNFPNQLGGEAWITQIEAEEERQHILGN